MHNLDRNRSIDEASTQLTSTLFTHALSVLSTSQGNSKLRRSSSRYKAASTSSLHTHIQPDQHILYWPKNIIRPRLFLSVLFQEHTNHRKLTCHEIRTSLFLSVYHFTKMIPTISIHNSFHKPVEEYVESWWGRRGEAYQQQEELANISTRGGGQQQGKQATNSIRREE